MNEETKDLIDKLKVCIEPLGKIHPDLSELVEVLAKCLESKDEEMIYLFLREIGHFDCLLEELAKEF